MGVGGVYTGSSILTNGVYTHLVAVFEGGSGGTSKLYINGVLIQEETNVVTSNGYDYICINNNPGHTGHGWHGCMSELRIYDSALSDEEIQLLFEEAEVKEESCIYTCPDMPNQFDWDTLVAEGGDEIPEFDYDIILMMMI